MSFLKKQKITVAVILAMAFGACSDWLDLKPYDGVTEADYWVTKEDVFAVLTGCYSSMVNSTLISNMFYWGEMRGDLVTGSSQASNDVMNIVRGEITPENKILKWNEFYSTISYCNKLIERAPLVLQSDYSFTKDLCDLYVSEAVAIRSLLYFYLVRSFSDVPFITFATNNDKQDFSIPQTPGPAILDSLVKHLEKALPKLATNFSSIGENKGRMTRYAAMTLLADIQLWRGDNLSCINYCNQVIAGPFALIEPSETEYTIIPVFTPGNIQDAIDTVYTMSQAYTDRLFDQLYVAGNSVESILEIQFPATHPSLADPFYTLFHGSSTVAPITPKEDNLMENVFPPYEYSEYVSGTGIRDIRSSGLAYKTGLVWKWVGTSYSGNVRRTQRSYPNWIVYRLPDVLLMKAEALNQLYRDDQEKQKEAYDLVRHIRWRNNAVSSESVVTSLVENGVEYTTLDADELEQLILDERAREFIGEGKRWYDVLRFALRDNPEGGSKYLMSLAATGAPPDKTFGMREKYKNKWFLYWPVFIDEIENNKNLIQNQFYIR